MSVWLTPALSLVAVLGLAWLARALGLGGDARIDSDGARALVEANGFVARDLIVDRAGFAALAHNGDRGFVLVRRHGSHFVAEPVTPALVARLDHRFLTVGRVTLDLGDAAGSWAARLRRLAT